MSVLPANTDHSLPQPPAVLLIAHGSRRPEANRDLADLARLVAAEGTFEIVEISYLELAAPTIPEGGRRCVERGARQVLLLPYFLSAGTHVAADLERFRSELAAAHAGVEFVLCPPLGLHPLMTRIVLDRLAEGRAKKYDGPGLEPDPS